MNQSRSSSDVVVVHQWRVMPSLLDRSWGRSCTGKDDDVDRRRCRHGSLARIPVNETVEPMLVRRQGRKEDTSHDGRSR
jgi:hypothetical protein